MESTIGIALLGCGTVGGGVAELLEQRRSILERRAGTAYKLVGIGNRSRDLLAVIDDPGVDVVIETLGGTGIALECIERALEARKHVVTANKDAIGLQGPRLRALAHAKGVTLRYEAAVASAVPIVATLDGPLAGDDVIEIGGILNGTCNVILGLMGQGHSFEASLRRAQSAGYAEADPRSDLEGVDSAHKLAILVQHAFGEPVITPRIPHSGITPVTSVHVRRARQHGYELKLVAHAVKNGSSIAAQVGPVLVPFGHAFAKITGADNVVRVAGAFSGPLFFSGAGAGRWAASASILGDLVACLRAISERQAARRVESAVAADDRPVLPAFRHFPVFAGYPVFPLTPKGDSHAGYSSRSLCAV